MASFLVLGHARGPDPSFSVRRWARAHLLYFKCTDPKGSLFLNQSNRRAPEQAQDLTSRAKSDILSKSLIIQQEK